MKPHRSLRLVILVFLPVLASAGNPSTPQPLDLSKAPAMSKETRQNLVHAFEAELVYIRTAFPMGRVGLKLHNGLISPSGQELQMMMATYGPAAKPGDLARISDIRISDRSIHFEINGGPVKKKKWYQRIEVGGMGGTTPIAPSDSNANARGSFVDLIFDRSVPEMTPPQLKQLLLPVFDFNSKSAVEAYLETVPPKVKQAIKNHQVLVGMNHEMVIYSKGRPAKKDREKDGGTDYEEWIYGEPPQDVEFVRFVSDEVVRDEVMKVGGEKIVKTEKEVNIEKGPAEAKASEQSRPANAPTLRRPGEAAPDTTPAAGPTNTRPAAAPGPTGPSIPTDTPDPNGVPRQTDPTSTGGSTTPRPAPYPTGAPDSPGPPRA
ncbi:MAG: hypothetical protein JO249_18755 [Acidobacteria bacterium]|nr:hypothetical protein [Acidobacteriota bacterium]